MNIQKRYNAFTLIELLVVVAIIALLIAILLPSLGKARNQAKRSYCAANLKSIGTASVLYNSSFEGQMPIQTSIGAVYNSGTYDVLNPANVYNPTYNLSGGNDTHSALGTLLGMLNGISPQDTTGKVNDRMVRFLYCPMATLVTTNAPNTDNIVPATPSIVSYLPNGMVLGRWSGSRWTPRRISSIRNAAGVVFAQEDFYAFGVSYARPKASGAGSTTYSNWCNPQPQIKEGGGQEYNSTHDKGGNLLFVDGHAEYKRFAEIIARDFGLTDGAQGKATDTCLTPGVSQGTQYRSLLD